MATSYDELWTTFVDSSGIDVATLPQSDRYIYALINKAVDLYNEKIDEEFYDTLETNNTSEEITPALDRRKLRILAMCLNVEILKMQLEDFNVEWQYDQSAVKSRFYKDQNSARQTAIKNLLDDIDQRIVNMNNNEWYN